jgi:hypothetical protein
MGVTAIAPGMFLDPAISSLVDKAKSLSENCPLLTMGVRILQVRR